MNDVLRLLNELEDRSTNRIEITNKMRPCSRFIIPVFLNFSTFFDRHTAHHQELKNCNCSLWFYIRLWLPAAVGFRQPQTYVKPEAAITVFELLMMSCVSLETG